MYKYTRKYYIHDQEVSFETLMKYIEIKLQNVTKIVDFSDISFNDTKEEI